MQSGSNDRSALWVQLARLLGLVCNAANPSDPANEFVIYDLAKSGIAAAVHDASQIVRIADLLPPQPAEE